MPRVAIAVRAGDEVLGSIWAAVPGPLSEERTEALRDAAKLVALHLLRVRAGADVQRRLRADLLSSALEGGAGAREALERLGLAGQPLLVLGVAVSDADDEGTATGADRRPRAAAAQRRVRDAPRRRAPALGGRPGRRRHLRPGAGDRRRRATARSARVRIAHDFLDRVGDRQPAGRSAVGPVAADLAGLAYARACADRALRVLRERPRRAPGRPASTTSRSRR